jgi:hypothetical protein
MSGRDGYRAALYSTLFYFPGFVLEADMFLSANIVRLAGLLKVILLCTLLAGPPVTLLVEGNA